MIRLKFSKPPETFVSALAEHIFHHPNHYIQFDDATGILTQGSHWNKRPKKKKKILANLSISRDTGNLKYWLDL